MDEKTQLKNCETSSTRILEVKLVYKKKIRSIASNDLMESFLFCDYDNKGYLTLLNHRVASEEAGNTFGEEEEKMFKKYGIKALDGTYNMTYECFETMMKNLKKDIFTCLGAFLQEALMDRGDPGINDASPFWLL